MSIVLGGSLSVTEADFSAVLNALGASGGQCYPLADLAKGANKVVGQTDPVSAAVFLATMTQESAYFRTTEEYSKTGTYTPYIGRTFEQITWKYNYQAFGEWCVQGGYTASPDLFVNRPELLAEMQWAWLGGLWYFGARKLWDAAAAGDFQTVQVKVNGASPFPSGWATRLKAYQQWTSRVVKPKQLTVNGQFDAATKTRLQQWVGVAMDGAFGSVSYAALQKWLGRTADGTFSLDDTKALQKAIGTYVDGQWGPGTNKALQKFLNVNGV